MLGLYLLAAHLVGDFVLQSRWQAVKKFGDWRFRARHVVSYVLPFVVVLTVVRPGWIPAGAFLVALAGLHFATDSRRFYSNIADLVAWKLMRDEDRREAVAASTAQNWDASGTPVLSADRMPADWVVLTPNPWPSLPLAVDQTLHVVQLAVLGGIFLS